MSWPVVIVPNGGLAVTLAANGLGLPYAIAANGFGQAITFVASGGFPVVEGEPLPIVTADSAAVTADASNVTADGKHN